MLKKHVENPFLTIKRIIIGIKSIIITITTKKKQKNQKKTKNKKSKIVKFKVQNKIKFQQNRQKFHKMILMHLYNDKMLQPKEEGHLSLSQKMIVNHLQVKTLNFRQES